MQTPKRGDFEAYLHDLRYYADRTCPKCSGQTESVLAYVSVHTKMFDNCAGSGKVKRLDIPYCPKCEPVPELYGCIHV